MAQNLNKASKKAIYQSKVSQLDSFGKDKFNFTKVEYLSIVSQQCADFVSRVINNINKIQHFVVTGAITDIQIKTTEEGVIITAPPHLIYQDRGVNGSVEKRYKTPHSYKDKKPPVQAFIEWIKNNNSIHLDDEKYGGDPSKFKDLSEDKKIESAAWGMAMNVFKYGYKGRNFYAKEIPKLIEDLQTEIASFAVQYVFQNIPIQPRGGGGSRVVLP